VTVDLAPDMTLLVHDLMHYLIAFLAEAHHLKVAAAACEAGHPGHGVPAPVAQRLRAHSLMATASVLYV